MKIRDQKADAGSGRNKTEKTEKKEIKQKVFSYMEKHSMITFGDKIVVGVSGGADSVCLLLLLLEYGRKIPVSLRAVHVNHGLRADAGEDARYVEELCSRLKVPFCLAKEDVRDLAAREKCSEEDAGRRARYRAFCRAAEEMGGAKIAVAHNMGDNAETMLFHLFRGSGLKGLCGIAPVRDNVIRPILCLERREIEAYLRECGVSWRTDSTNGEDHYRRNRIRHHILPYAESEVAQGAAAHICRTAELLSETEDYLEQQTRAAWEQCVRTEGEARPETPGQSCGPAERDIRCIIDVGRFSRLHIVLQKRILLEAAKALSPTGKDISAVHVEDALSLFNEAGNRDLNLPFGICARRRYGEVTLERKDREAFLPRKSGEEAARRDFRGEPGKQGSSGETPDQGQQADSAGKEVELPAQAQGYPAVVELEGGGSLEFCIIFGRKGQEVPKNQYTKWLDYDKIIESPVVRSRRPGDFLTIADGEGRLVHKSLKDYMITEKIPRERRERIPVLASGSHVMWLVGCRISEYFKVNENTKHILQVQLKKTVTVGETEEENVGTH